MANVLIHIGYRKAASTFVRELFINHPQLHFKHTGIAGFNNTLELVSLSDSEKKSYYVLSDNYTFYRGKNPPKTKENIQNYQVNACKILKNIFPNAKILIITRSAKSSILSGYFELIKNGHHLSSKELLSQKESKSNLEGHLDYNFLVSLYIKTFGEKSVIVLPYELLKESPDIFLNHIEKELGLNHFSLPLSSINPSLTPNENYWYLMFSKFIFACCKPFGSIGEYFYNNYIKWMGKKRLYKKRLKYIVNILTILFGKKEENVELPDELIEELKAKATIFRTIPIYEKYLHLYC